MTFLVLVCSVLLIISSPVNGLQQLSDDFKDELKEIVGQTAREISSSFLEYTRTGVMPDELAEFSRYVEPPADVAKLNVGKLKFNDQKLLCIACRSAVTIAIEFVKNSTEKERDEFKDIAVNLCVFFKIQPEHVCVGLVELNWPVLDYILRHNQTELDEETVCGVLLQGSNCGNSNPKFDWKLQIDPNHPKITSHKEIPKNSASKKLRILHLTDIHYDPSYIVGGKADCEEPLCCRTPLGNFFSNNTKNVGAGKWSDYRECDVPWEMYTDSLEHIQKQHQDFDLIYFTGDIIDHGVWETSTEGNIKSIQAVHSQMKKIFGNTPVFPVLGNHEPHPLNLYAPDDVTRPDLSTQWLYDFMAEEWKDWLPQSSAQETIQKGGYYTVVPREGFRIIALNNNDAYTLNFWLLYKPTYISKQLQWMHDILLEAEKARELVHILMHIPSGDGTCFNTWSREFRRVVERFHHIIGGIFLGHTHFDEFNLHYSQSNPSKAINVAWNGGSLTPFYDVNPNYRTYEVETSTYQVTKHETWIFNLTDANLNPQRSPVWFKEYSFKETYGLKDLSPRSLDILVEKFKKDKTLLHKYWRHKVKLGDPSLKQGCDNKCLTNHLCELLTTQSNDQTKCDKLK